MWLVNPRLMCRQHLLGEHVELHMMVGCLVRGKSLAGYIETGLIDTALIRRRHLELVREMERRGYTHASELPAFKAPVAGGSIDAAGNLLELRRRCKSCASRMKDHQNHSRGRKKTQRQA
jgi:hypothetical protein